MLRRQPWDLGLTSSRACLLLPHKPNHCKIRPTSKVSAVSLEVRKWLNWRKNWGWLWESNKWSHYRPAQLPPQVLARPRQHRTRSRVQNAAKPLVVDQKICEMLVDVVPQLRALSGSSGDLGGYRTTWEEGTWRGSTNGRSGRGRDTAGGGACRVASRG